MDAPAIDIIDPFSVVNLVIWGSALLSLMLLFTVGSIADIFTSRRRDLIMRFMQSVVFLLIPLLGLVPAMAAVIETSGRVGYGMVLYVAFFAMFIYYLGKDVGINQGKRHMGELVGLDSPGNLEDAQDRLFESRMRFPTRAGVVESIGRMAREREAEKLEAERLAAGRKAPPTPPPETKAVPMAPATPVSPLPVEPAKQAPSRPVPPPPPLPVPLKPPVRPEPEIKPEPVDTNPPIEISLRNRRQ
ncbi:MAG: hypothetical protein LIP77_06130 [Planctomycetes bacterium]|nr:hypothetical protein [Planctomycetota bacterium]